MRLRTTLLLRGAVLPAAFLLGTIVLGGLLFERSLMQSVDDSLRNLAAVESVSVFDQAVGPHLHRPEPPLFRKDEPSAISRAVYAENGERVVALGLSVPTPARLPTAALGSEPILRTRILPSSQEIRELIVPVRGPGNQGYALWLAHPTETVRATVRTYARTTGAVGALAVLFLLIQQGRFAGRLASRIRNLSSHMERLVKGDLTGRPAPDPRRDELGALRASIAHATQKLERARRAQERLIADAAHELRTPLAAMRAHIDVTLRRDREKRELVAACEEIREEVDRLAALATKLLHLARGRHAEWMMATRDLRPLLVETIQGRHDEADEKHLDVSLDVPRGIEVRSDAGAMRQAFENLLANAIKFSPDGSRVEVVATDAGENWRIVFSNEGPAIPVAEREAIFEPFRRLDARKPGSGLGLTIAREIVERHGGQVDCAPTEIGVTFVVTLPKPSRDPPSTW